MKILVADDHPVVRRGVAQILTSGIPACAVGEAHSFEDLFHMVQGQQWDLLVLDMAMPGGNGLTAIKTLKHAYPRLPVLVLSLHPEDQFGAQALKAGASGYITKERASDDLICAAKTVLSGRKYLSASLAERLVLNLQSGSDGPPHENLSSREYQILGLIASGRMPKQIAGDLRISVKTVSTHRSRILHKLRVTNNAELVQYAMKNKLIE